MESIKCYIENALLNQEILKAGFPKANYPFPCSVCFKNVNTNQKSIKCNSCCMWVHIRCNGTSTAEFENLSSSNTSSGSKRLLIPFWNCMICVTKQRAEIFPFGLLDNHDLNNVIQVNSFNSLKNIPSIDIFSKSQKYDSLSNSNIDNNIGSFLDSRYYNVHEFKNLLSNDNHLNIFHSNLNGLESKFDELNEFISTTKMNLDLICISETSQKNDDDFLSNISIDNYYAPYTTGSNFARGGVAIYAKNNLHVTERLDLKENNDYLEAIWVEISVKNGKNIICGCVYRHPNSDIALFTDYIDKSLSKISKENKECYLSGDFNIDLLKYDDSCKHRDFLNLMVSFGFLPQIIHPTRITDYSSTVIDNIFTNNSKDKTMGGNILFQFADHLCQFVSIQKNMDRIKPICVYRRDLGKIDHHLFSNELNLAFHDLNNHEGTNGKFNSFLNAINQCLDKYAPLKRLNKKEMKAQSKPWINLRLRKMISHRESLFRRKKKNANNYFETE